MPVVSLHVKLRAPTYQHAQYLNLQKRQDLFQCSHRHLVRHEKLPLVRSPKPHWLSTPIINFVFP